jgi:hypothetical protein
VPERITHQNLLTIKLSKALKDGALAGEKEREMNLLMTKSGPSMLLALQKYTPQAYKLGQ